MNIDASDVTADVQNLTDSGSSLSVGTVYEHTTVDPLSHTFWFGVGGLLVRFFYTAAYFDGAYDKPHVHHVTELSPKKKKWFLKV